MNFIIGQVISVIALLISVVIAQFKDVRYILLGEIASNLTVALSYLFLGGMSGAWVCIVAAIQTWIIYRMNKKDISEQVRKRILCVFALIYVIGTVIVFRGWADILTCICALLYLMAVSRAEGVAYRRYMILNSLLWVVYDIVTMAFVNVITHGTLLVSLIIARCRLDKGGKQE